VALRGGIIAPDCHKLPPGAAESVADVVCFSTGQEGARSSTHFGWACDAPTQEREWPAKGKMVDGDSAHGTHETREINDLEASCVPLCVPRFPVHGGEIKATPQPSASL
jgi:hypothetical protein